MWEISYHDINLLWSRIHLKWINLCYCAKSWRQNYLSQSHFEDDSSPYISWSGSLIRISLTFVLFKNVTFRLINYLETWSRSDNMSCYYKYQKSCSLAQWYNTCLTIARPRVRFESNNKNWHKKKEKSHFKKRIWFITESTTRSKTTLWKVIHSSLHFGTFNAQIYLILILRV